ncbi:unnamed protein product [Amoebophrya sp. A120]|nr:unnamed protein product [Amoebophrya sp. A120]|eukprot:GSA120T00000959001.1
MVVPPHYQPPPSSQHFYNSPGCLYYPPPGAAAWSAPPAPGGSPPEHALYENWWSPAAQGPPPPTGDPAGVHTAGTSPGSSNKPGSSSDVPPRRPAGDLPHVDTSGDKPTHEPKIGTSTLNSSQLVQEDQKARAAKAEEQRRRLAWKKVEAGVRKGTSLPPFPPNEAPFHAFPPANLVGGVVGDYPRPAGPAPRRTENTEPPLIQHPPEDDLAGRKKRARVLLPLPGGKVFDPDAKKAAHDQAASEAV